MCTKYDIIYRYVIYDQFITDIGIIYHWLEYWIPAYKYVQWDVSKEIYILNDDTHYTSTQKWFSRFSYCKLYQNNWKNIDSKKTIFFITLFFKLNMMKYTNYDSTLHIVKSIEIIVTFKDLNRIIFWRKNINKIMGILNLLKNIRWCNNYRDWVLVNKINWRCNWKVFVPLSK